MPDLFIEKKESIDDIVHNTKDKQTPNLARVYAKTVHTPAPAVMVVDTAILEAK
jgi:hypothetical protein